jgi:hypothetical protein
MSRPPSPGIIAYAITASTGTHTDPIRSFE